jgi:glycosyltransferase involved in cell wall biosynthesis
VGRINSRKNIPNLLKAFQSIEDKQIKLILVGKREWKTDDLNSLLDDPSISNRVIFSGSVSNEELSVIYSNAHIFCFPSFEEAFGLPPLEAMASGIPVVVSNSSSLPEVCGDAAIYVNANEPDEIAKAITRLLNDKDLYNEHKQLSVDRAKAFSWTITTQNLIGILEKRYVT